MRTTTLVAALSLAVLGCAKGDKTASDSSGARDTTAATPPTGSAAAGATASATAPGLTDDHIAALLDEMNVADSTFGKIASTRGTSGDVKAFAALMMKDHHAMRKSGQDLVAKLGITPAAPANDSLPMKTQKVSDSLNVIAKGPAFDVAYIDDEVANHQEVLRFLDTALGAAQHAEMKDMLTKARPSVEMHLKRAQDIRTRLGSGAKS